MQESKGTQSQIWVDRLVWTVWGLMGASIVFFVLRYGSPLPFGDEWDDTVPVLTGERLQNLSTFLNYLWHQHNAHRFPLPRLLNIILLGIFHSDFRVVMVMDTFFLIGTCYLLLQAARRLRGGHFSITDVILPVALLNWGHFENLLWALQSAFILTSSLVCLILVNILSTKERITERKIWQIGSLVALLPLCGGQALTFAVVFMVWLLYVAFFANIERNTRIVAGSFIAVTLLLFRMYFTDYLQQPSNGIINAKVVEVGLEFLGIAFGTAIRDFGVMAHLPLNVTLKVIPIFLLISVGVLLFAWRKKEERQRILGLFLMLCGVVLLALAIGSGRTGGLESRYMVLSVLSVCVMHFTFLLYAPNRFGLVLSILLTGVVCLFFPINQRIGLDFGHNRRAKLTAFANDLPKHLSPTLIAMRHWEGMGQYPRTLVRELNKLRIARVGKFASVGVDPPMHRLSLLSEKSTLHGITLEKGIMRVTGKDASRVFNITPPPLVYGVQIDYTYPQGRADIRPDKLQLWHIAWKHPDQQEVPLPQQKKIWEEFPQIATTGSITIYLYEKVDQIILRADTGATPLELKELTLLVGDPSAKNPAEEIGTKNHD